MQKLLDTLQMSNSHLPKEFCLKPFSVVSGGDTSMAIGTDAVLLGAWVNIPITCHNVVDVGCGCGIIALMLTYRAQQLKVCGIDINPAAVKTATSNAASTPYGDNVSFACVDARQFVPPHAVDLVVSNPPFFPAMKGKASVSPTIQRTMARQGLFLSSEELIIAAKRLTTPCGQFAVIVPQNEAPNFEFLAAMNEFHLLRSTDVITVEGKKPKRSLMQFQKDSAPHDPIRESITLYSYSGEKTPQYTKLTQDFYL